MSAAQKPLKFAWLEVTGFCNEHCDHCYADSSPQGTHGTMTVDDWKGAIDQLADIGARDVQFIGGEPTLYPHLHELISHAHGAGLAIEVFSNLTYVREHLWDVFTRCGVKLATSYYSDSAQDHDKVTNLRGSHRRTRANIKKALSLGVPLRGGIVAVHTPQRVHEAAEDLTTLGVQHVGGDRTRAFGRGSNGAYPTVDDLCGHCALGQCAIGPDGNVWPCVLGRFITLGNVRETPLAEIWNSPRTAEARAEIAAAQVLKSAQACTPPQFLPSCGPCSPCVPSVGHCDPQEATPATATIGAPA
ncbi:radical SAM protein [Streptomyces sioyaensis]|uniref:radical SAM/SPASM domain-containing protein n=1 Tax=Streptomyces sioyaensis TaxID=67364 RepID=UPI001F1DD4B5|nr:radical SAM/SPASM domain-containing protein [Streptomyces sioyaensis]MCF3177553.1 radical SAM protein [Streptomyces sioyaensis]